MSKQGNSGKGKRIPKRIGGVKIPKEVRRGGEALIGALEEPATRQALASGLKAAAGVFAASVAAKAGTRPQGGAGPVPPVPPTPPHPPEPPVPPVPPHARTDEAAATRAEPWSALVGLAAASAGAALEGWLRGRPTPGPVDPATGEPPEAPGQR